MGQGYKFSSVASRFKRQLAELMDALFNMEPHYIRCIKPNSRNKCAAAATDASTLSSPPPRGLLSRALFLGTL